MGFWASYTSGNMRGMERATNLDHLIKKLNNISGIQSWEIFRDDNGFHSSTQDEYLVKWWSKTGRTYWDNRAKNEPELMQKKFGETSQSTDKFSMADAARESLGIREADIDPREINMISDIGETWQDPREITQDIQEFLMQEYKRNMGEDFQTEDIIDAIEKGIQEFRKITNI